MDKNSKPASKPAEEEKFIDSLGQENPAEAFQKKIIKEKEEKAQKEAHEAEHGPQAEHGEKHGIFPKHGEEHHHGHEADAELEAHTVEELRTIAHREGADLSGATVKADIIKAIKKNRKKS